MITSVGLYKNSNKWKSEKIAIYALSVRCDVYIDSVSVRRNQIRIRNIMIQIQKYNKFTYCYEVNMLVTNTQEIFQYVLQTLSVLEISCTYITCTLNQYIYISDSLYYLALLLSTHFQILLLFIT